MASRSLPHPRSRPSLDASLEPYRRKRNFDRTAEPAGGTKTAAARNREALSFVVQKHDATRLHYDFRLEWNGVLKSWAVTKGPSDSPADKRLAVQVEDHPLEYGSFEGIIPKGQYGGGTVMLWDSGTWEPDGDVDKGLAKGHLKFTLQGEKLRGKWALIRMGGRAAEKGKSNWLLIKEHDEYARAADKPAITDKAPNSVTSGRNLEEIASQHDQVWNSGREHRASSRGTRAGHSDNPRMMQSDKQLSAAIKNALLSLPREALPKFVPPQLASAVVTPPGGDGWLHELKLDGYRIQANISTTRGQRTAQLLTRKALDWTHRMPDIAAQLAQVLVDSAVLDGEVVALDPSGVSSFQLLQAAFQEGKRQRLYYFIFDLLHLEGRNLRELPLEKRKALLKDLLEPVAADGDPILRLSEHLELPGPQVFAKACKLGAEGIVSKRASLPYAPGRGRGWLKAKCGLRQEFVIGGFTLPSDESYEIGALLLGYYDQGKLIYAGRTGTGFTEQTRAKLRKQLESIRQPRPAFDAVPSAAQRKAYWVKPELVAEVRFATWTADNLVRQSSFQGIREDKPASQVVRETSGSGDTEAGQPTTVAQEKEALPRSRLSTKRSAPQANPHLDRLTHADKELDPDSHLTKRELADYYWAVAGHMLPHIAGRPLSLVRCPDGSKHPCFFQKHAARALPAGIESVPVPERKGGKPEDYLTLSTPEGLVALAQMGVLEVHPWGSRNDSIETPDRLIFDLDPGEGVPWSVLGGAAEEVRKRLRKLGLTSFLKTTGGKGLHVVAPILPEHPWPTVKEFAHQFAREIEQGNPALYLTKMTRAERKGRIYIDYLRNDRGATAIAPYSPRARSGAPAALPLDWKELATKAAPVFRVHDFAQWATRLEHDPWKKMSAIRQSLRLD